MSQNPMDTNSGSSQTPTPPKSASKEEKSAFTPALKEKARKLRVDLLDLAKIKLDPKVSQILSETVAKRHNVLVIEQQENRLVLGMQDPSDVVAIDDVRLRTNLAVTPVLVDPAALASAMESVYGRGGGMEQFMKEAIGHAADSMDLAEDQKQEEEEAVIIDTPLIRMVNQIIYKALESRASDIHIEAYEKEVLVRYRIDGVLHNVMTPPKDLLPAIVSRIKIMSNLKIDEKRVPQDGRIHMIVKELNRDLDLRVSTLPTLFGESVVMRILDRSSMNVNLGQLGITEEILEPWTNLASRPHGMILITGPTGSGKSTTIYATLNLLNSSEVKIVTIEDPVEYSLKGVNQVQINPRIGLTFATGLRAFLRQDPDIMMVGEIRDRETATIAMESALTGHLVLSTLHTNTSVGAITRLIDMGIEPFLISATILGVLAQRLVRVVCDKCKEPVSPPEKLLKIFEEQGIKEVSLFRGVGCAHCSETGYRGRRGIYELFIPSIFIKSLISQGVTEDVLLQKALEEGLKILYQDGLKKVAQGLTTYEELLRVASKEQG